MAKVKRKDSETFKYFVEKLGKHERAENWRWVEMPLDSNCGSECKKAIDAAAEFLNHVRTARRLRSQAPEGGGRYR